MKDRVLVAATVVYCLASLLHFTHNGAFLADYPNLPTFITVATIAWTWLSIASIGVAGCLLLYFQRPLPGLSMLAVYAAFGFDGLAHYGVAPLSAHTFGMNATIWLEVLAAAILLCVVVRRLVSHVRGDVRPRVAP